VDASAELKSDLPGTLAVMALEPLVRSLTDDTALEPPVRSSTDDAGLETQVQSLTDGP